MKLSDTIAKHRAIADFLAEHKSYFEGLPAADYPNWRWDSDVDGYVDGNGDAPSYVTLSTFSTIDITCHGPDSKELMTAIRRHLGGKWDKGGYGSTFTLRQQHDNFTIEIDGPREQVCTARQVGTRTVEKFAPDAPKITVEEPIIEWDCDPMLVGE